MYKVIHGPPLKGLQKSYYNNSNNLDNTNNNSNDSNDSDNNSNNDSYSGNKKKLEDTFNNIKNINISTNLNNYLWYEIISLDVLQDKYQNRFRNKQGSLKFIEKEDKNILKKEFISIDKIVDNKYLNQKIIRDHDGRGWEFFFNKKYSQSIILDRTKYENDESFTKDLDKELNILTKSEEIKRKIKITSYQVVQVKIMKQLVDYFNTGILRSDNIMLILKFKPDNNKKVIVEIGNYNNDIITNINSYFILIVHNFISNISYDICKIDFNCIINFTKDKIDIKYKFNYKNDLYKNIVIKLSKLYFKKIEEDKKNTMNLSTRLRVDKELFSGERRSYENILLIYEILFSSNIANNIEKQKIFYNYIYKLLKNIKDKGSYNIFEDTIKFLHKKCNLIENNIIPVTKNIKDKVRSDFLIVSYNEEAEQFTYNDCLPIIFKILDENPSFIFVCTQESKSGNFRNIFNAGHYQHVLGTHITKLDYARLTKIDASVIGIKDKNVRTRIYINTNNVRYDIFNKTIGNLRKDGFINDNSKNKVKNIIKEDNSFNLDKKKYETIKNIDNKYIITSFGSKKSVESGLGSDTGLGFKKVFTLYKGSIFVRLEFTKKINNVEKDYKIIVVNSHLFYKKSGDTGVKEREKELTDIIKEFKLIEHWKKGYNIFFCGDMNFRLNKVKEKNKTLEDYKSIISTYLLNNSKYKEESSKNLKLKNELYNYIFKHSSYENDLNNSLISNFEKTLKNNPNYSKYIIKNLLFENISNNNSDELKKLKTQLKNDYDNYILNYNLKRNRNGSVSSNNLEEYLDAPFYNSLKYSIDKLGVHLSSKYYEGQSLKNIKFYKDKSINSEEIFDIYPKKDGKNLYARVPSATDRIIFALSEKDNIKISPYNFNVHLFPDKSDHKMISLSFELCDNSDNNSDIINNVNIIFNKNKRYGTYTPSSVTHNELSNRESNNYLSETNFVTPRGSETNFFTPRESLS
jgi:hypothetical protein